MDDGTSRDEVLLDDPALALLIPAMVWGSQFQFSPDAVLVVLASRPYEPDDYIRTYAGFLEALGDRR